jgi:hypothetical protein
MPMWRCPHCATPQAETARCWVCHRSSTACGACRHFRRSVAGQLGYCGLDRARAPLTGDEIRPCWEPAEATGTSIPALPGVGQVWPLEAIDDGTLVRPLEFVEIEPRRIATIDASAIPPDAVPGKTPIGPAAAGERWSFWSDLES